MRLIGTAVNSNLLTTDLCSSLETRPSFDMGTSLVGRSLASSLEI